MSVSKTLQQLEVQLREKLDPLGFVDDENGAYMTGHEPSEFPRFYLFRRYASLNEEELLSAEKECGRYIYEPYREFLSRMNGANLLGMVFQGLVGGSLDRTVGGVGQPITLRYGNVVDRPEYIPNGHLRFGSINGEWYSQGHLFLTSAGEVELYNALFDTVGHTWPSFEEFLADEIPRRLRLYDENGRVMSGSKKLPGQTDDWEQLAKEHKEGARAKDSLVGKLRAKIRRS